VKRLISLTALVIFLTACGGTPKIGDQPLTQQKAEELKFIAPLLASATVNSLRQQTQAMTLSGQQASGNCGQASYTDADKDSVPALYNSTFVDCTENKLIWIEVKNGVVNVADKDDNNPQSGFTSRATNLRVDYFANNSGQKGENWGRVVQNWDANVDVSATGSRGSFVLKIDLTNVKENKSWSGSLDIEGSYVPKADNDLNNFDAGTINFQGQIQLGDFVLGKTITNLTFDETCEAGPVSGKVRYDDGGQNFFEVTYTGCNKGTFSYNSTGSGTFN
jgi:hypothetical protein